MPTAYRSERKVAAAARPQRWAPWSLLEFMPSNAALYDFSGRRVLQILSSWLLQALWVTSCLLFLRSSWWDGKRCGLKNVQKTVWKLCKRVVQLLRLQHCKGHTRLWRKSRNHTHQTHSATSKDGISITLNVCFVFISSKHRMKSSTPSSWLRVNFVTSHWHIASCGHCTIAAVVFLSTVQHIQN